MRSYDENWRSLKQVLAAAQSTGKYQKTVRMAEIFRPDKVDLGTHLLILSGVLISFLALKRLSRQTWYSIRHNCKMAQLPVMQRVLSAAGQDGWKHEHKSLQFDMPCRSSSALDMPPLKSKGSGHSYVRADFDLKHAGVQLTLVPLCAPRTAYCDELVFLGLLFSSRVLLTFP